MPETLRRMLLRLPIAWAVVLVSAGAVLMSVACILVLFAVGLDMGPRPWIALVLSAGVPALVAPPCIWIIVKLLHEAQQARDEALRLAWNDDLTGLLNRRRFIELGRREVMLAGRSKQGLCAALLDLDDFKRINDTHGHGAGDAVLRATGLAFRCALRSSDLSCRWGGEEFALILPGLARDEAEQILQRLLEVLRATRVVNEDGALLSFTASVGVAAWTAGELNFERLIQRADLALYAAKREGKNRVYLSHDAGDTTQHAVVAVLD